MAPLLEAPPSLLHDLAGNAFHCWVSAVMLLASARVMACGASCVMPSPSSGRVSGLATTTPDPDGESKGRKGEQAQDLTKAQTPRCDIY